MRQFIVYYHVGGLDRHRLYVRGVTPIKAAEFYAVHMQKATNFFNNDRVKRIGVMEIADNGKAGVKVAKYHDGDLYFIAIKAKRRIFVKFDKTASQYTSDTPDWEDASEEK